MIGHAKPSIVEKAMWIPVAFDGGRDDNGIWRSEAHFGEPTSREEEAWSRARALCDSMHGIGFCVRTAESMSEVAHG